MRIVGRRGRRRLPPGPPREGGRLPRALGAKPARARPASSIRVIQMRGLAQAVPESPPGLALHGHLRYTVHVISDQQHRHGRRPSPSAAWLLIAVLTLFLGVVASPPHGHGHTGVGLYDQRCPLAGLDSLPRHTLVPGCPTQLGRPDLVGSRDTPPISAAVSGPAAAGSDSRAPPFA